MWNDTEECPVETPEDLLTDTHNWFGDDDRFYLFDQDAERVNEIEVRFYISRESHGDSAKFSDCTFAREFITDLAKALGHPMAGDAKVSPEDLLNKGIQVSAVNVFDEWLYANIVAKIDRAHFKDAMSAVWAHRGLINDAKAEWWSE